MNINYKKAFPESIAAEGKEKNFLRLQKLDKPIKRFDGKTVSYFLQHRWLSVECKNENDEAWACSLGSDLTYWSEKELPIEKLKNRTALLFDVVSLY